MDPIHILYGGAYTLRCHIPAAKIVDEMTQRSEESLAFVRFGISDDDARPSAEVEASSSCFEGHCPGEAEGIG
jgi:hypothetical protein